jgi:hypothetical protein
MPLAFRFIRNSISELDFGEVIAAFLPTRSSSLWTSEFGMVTSDESATVRVPTLTMTTSKPSRCAANAAAMATSP